MDHQPKKSRAFLITFIAVMLLLLVAYFIFKNSNQIFGTKSSTNTSKTFAPLLSTSSQKDVKVVTGGTQNSTGTQTPSDSTNTGSTTDTTGSFGAGGQITSGNGLATGNFGSSGSFGGTTTPSADTGSGAITPQFNPIPTPTDTGVTPPPAPTTTPPAPPVTPPANPNICPSDPLVFTADEQTQLDALLKQYYLIAPGLKTDDDVASVENDITTNQALIDQANALTNQCQAEKSDPTYTGPQSVKSNPYYTDASASNTPYLTDFSQFEQLFNIW